MFINELNKIITQLPKNSNALVSQISRIHSAAFRDPILRINSSKHCIKELNPDHEYCLPTFTYISVRHKGKKGRWKEGLMAEETGTGMVDESNLKESKRDPNQFGARL